MSETRPAGGAGIAPQPTLDVLAERWLAAERDAVAYDNEGGTEERAREAAVRYEAAVRAASLEDLLLAWHAGRKRQGACDMGSEAWAEARTVTELLGAEYEARRTLERWPVQVADGSEA